MAEIWQKSVPVTFFCIFKFHKVLQQYIAGEVEIFLWVKKIVGSYRDIRLREGLSPGDEL